MATHLSRERQFECNLCDAAYSRKDHLMAHVRRKHGNLDSNDVSKTVIEDKSGLDKSYF